MNLDILMHYDVDEQTGEVKFIGKEEVSIDTSVKKEAKKKTTSSVLEGSEPRLQLNANNFALNQVACDLLKIGAGDTVHINYPKKEGRYVPVIGSSEAFGVKAGNKLTKTLTKNRQNSFAKTVLPYSVGAFVGIILNTALVILCLTLFASSYGGFVYWVKACSTINFPIELVVAVILTPLLSKVAGKIKGKIL